MVSGFMIADLFPGGEFTFGSITPPPELTPEPMWPLIPAYVEVKQEEPTDYSYTSYLNSVFPFSRRFESMKKRRMPMTYKQMVIVAIGASPNKMANLGQLIDWIQRHFPECGDREEKSVKGSIRTALTRHPEFEKLDGIGQRVIYWTWNYEKAIPCKRNNGQALDMALLSFYKQPYNNPDYANRITLEDVLMAARATRNE